MKKLFTLFALLSVFLGAKAVLIEDGRVEFKNYDDISQVPRFSWGGAQQAWDRLSIVNGCLHWHSTEVPLNDDGEPTSWLAQWFPIGTKDAPEVGVTYTLHFKVKGDHTENISALGFGQTPYGQFPITTEWVEGAIDYECTSADGNILMQAGGYIGDFDIEYLYITHDGKVERPVEWIELLKNGNAEQSWESLGLADVKYNDMDNNMKVCFWSKEKGHNLNADGGWDPFPAEIVTEADGNHAFICRAQLADTEGDPSAWDNQIWIESPRTWKTGEQFKLSFRYKASEPVKTNTQVHHQTPSDYLYWQAIGDIDFTESWQTYEQVVTVPADANGMWSIAFNLNPNVKTPVDFYIDDISWSQMKLDEGLFVASSNTVTAIDYDYDNAIEFVYDADVDAMAATVGTVGKEDSWVNEIMISTVRGNDRQFKANTLKIAGMAPSDPDAWVDYTEAASAKIKLPAEGVWTIYVDTNLKQMSFVEVEGKQAKEPITIVPNETEVIVAAVERDNTNAEVEGGTGQPWDNQFFLMANRELEVGEVTVIEFDYMADTDAVGNTQCSSAEPGGYLHWNAIGDVNFTTEWQHFEKTFTVPGEAAGMASLTFNLAVMKEANNYHIKNVIWKTEDDTETLIDMEGTKNFWVKIGGGTAPYQYGTDPDAIQNVAADKTNGVAHNLAGQAVSKNFQGVAIQNGKKFVVK